MTTSIAPPENQTQKQELDPLTQQLQDHENKKQRSLGEYIREGQRRSVIQDQCLHVFHGWDQVQDSLLEPIETPSGGYFIRWNDTGIAINPTKGFLKRFHADGFHIRDIDHIIITKGGEADTRDITTIHDLNAQVNALSTDLHTIHYYLSPKAYQELLSSLKPHFKQERETIHCMELFADSPDLESFELAPSIKLFYFPVAAPSKVGIRLDLGSDVRLGYVGGTGWSSQLSHHLKSSDILIGGFGSTSIQDYEKVHYNTHSLGYFGSSSLIEESKPKLFLCSEIEGVHGDLRLQVTKSLRQDTSSTILPADYGLHINLETLHIQCTSSSNWIPANEVRITTLAKPFGPITYLSPHLLI